MTPENIGKNVPTRNVQQFLIEIDLANKLRIDDIQIISFEYHLDKFEHSLFNHLDINYIEKIQKSTVKRQAEFLAGRFAAVQALEKIGYINCDIPIGPNRSPTWPQGVVASITHTSNKALCAVATDENMQYLGIDLENILTPQAAKEIESIVLNRQEYDLIKSAHISFELALTLVFSAKESVFKALYPYVKRYFEFDSAQLSSFCLERGHIEFTLTEDLTSEYVACTKVSGHFVIENGTVLSCIYKPKSDR